MTEQERPPVDSLLAAEEQTASCVISDEEDDRLQEIRGYYTKRLQSLERFKENLSTGAKKEMDKDAVEPFEESPDGSESKFNRLKSEMATLMEKDVHLMRQLLALGETIEELRFGDLSPGSSLASLTDVDYEEDSPHGEIALEQGVCQLVVNEDESPPLGKKQYFSRQNSVLRIPIPPTRHRNRHSFLLAKQELELDDSSSGVSSNSSIRSRGSSRTGSSAFRGKKVAELFKISRSGDPKISPGSSESSSSQEGSDSAKDSSFEKEVFADRGPHRGPHMGPHRNPCDRGPLGSKNLLLIIGESGHEPQNSVDSGIHLSHSSECDHKDEHFV